MAAEWELAAAAPAEVRAATAVATAATVEPPDCAAGATLCAIAPGDVVVGRGQFAATAFALDSS